MAVYSRIRSQITTTPSYPNGLVVTGGMSIGTNIDADVPLKVGTVTATGQIGLNLTSNTGAHLQLTDIGNVDMSLGVLDGQSALSFHTGRNRQSNGTELMRLTSSGNVGIGTSSPITLLHIDTSGYGALYLGANNSNGFHVTKESSDNSFNIWSGVFGSATNRLKISSSGQFTFSSPTSQNVATFFYPTAGGYSEISVNSNDRQIVLGQRSSTYSSGDLAYLYTPSATPFAIYTSASERMRISSSGSVGIGTSSPANKLHIAGETAQYPTSLYIAPTGHATSRRAGIAVDNWEWMQDIGGNGTKDFGLYDRDDGTIRVYVGTSGNVGIGTSSPDSYNSYGNNLVVKNTTSTGITIVSGSVDYGSIHFADGTTGADSYRGQIVYNHTTNAMSFSTDASERLRITSSGNVGIGTSSPGAILDIQGSTESLYLLRANGANSNAPNLRIRKARGSTTARTVITNGDFLGHITFEGYDGANFLEGAGIYGISNGAVSSNTMSSDLMFLTRSGTTLAERMRISSSGNVGIGTSSPLRALEINNALRFTNSSTDTNDGVIGSATFLSGLNIVGINTDAAGRKINFWGSFIQNENPIGNSLAFTTFTAGINFKASSVSANTTLDYSYTHVFASGTITITLPTAVGISGRTYWIKRTGTGTITIATTSSQTIDGSASLSISAQYDSYTLVSDGVNWYIM